MEWSVFNVENLREEDMARFLFSKASPDDLKKELEHVIEMSIRRHLPGVYATDSKNRVTSQQEQNEIKVREICGIVLDSIKNSIDQYMIKHFCQTDRGLKQDNINLGDHTHQ